MGLDQGVSPQILRAGEQMKALKIQTQFPDPLQQRRNLLGVDAKGFGAAAHLHPGGFQLEIGVDPHCDSRLLALLYAEPGDGFQLASRFQVNRNAGGDGCGQFRWTLAGAGKADMRGIHAGIQRHLHFTQRSDIQAINLPGEVLDQRRHWIRFDRVVQLECGWQDAPQPGDPLIDQAAVIGVKRRLSNPRRQLS